MEPMSQAELFELVAVYGATCMTALTLFLSFTFGYLTVAHFVGSRLTTVQAFGLTAVYLISAIASFLTAYANLSAMGSLQQELSSSPIYQRILFIDAGIYLVLVPVMCSSALLISLYLMYDVRRKGSDA
jgi:hypothetical protein